MFLTPQDFNKLPYSIANNGEDYNGPTIQTVIDRVEKDLLSEVLGIKLYNEFLLGVEALPDAWADNVDYVVDDEVYQGVTVWRALQPSTGVVPVEGADWTKVEDNKWLKLRDGYGYQYLEVDYEYAGLRSFLIPYVFAIWLKEFVDQTQTDGGVVVSDAENALIQGIRDKFVPAWNEACNRIGRNTQPRNSLWGFLKETYQTDYPDLVFCSPTKLNFFDF